MEAAIKNKVLPALMKEQSVVGCIFFFFFFFVFVFLGLHPWHMEVPRLGVELELQLLAYDRRWQRRIQASSAAYITAHSNAGSLTH